MTTNLGRKTMPVRHSAPSQPPTRDDQILSLLGKLGDQLTRSERERAQLGQKLSALEAQQQAQNAKLEQTQISQGKKLEQVSQDKVRLIRKLERIEEAVVETREALQSKALVLLTDQGAAARSGNPQLPADPSKALPPPTSVNAWKNWRAQITPRRTAFSAAAMIAVLLSGWAITHLPFGDSAPETTAAAMPPQPLPTVAETIPPPAPTATAMNDLTPAAAPLPAPTEIATTDRVQPAPAPAPINTKIASAPQTEAEIESFIAQQRTPGPLTDRVHPDPALPALARQIEQKAFAGVPEAEHDLAAIYTAGHAGVKPDYARAAFWFREAAIGGVANARYNLGVLYQQGMGVPKDMNRALGWYAAAAKLGHPEAEYNLGIADVEGVGTAYNPQRAAQFFEKAANGGVTEAAYNLGLIYENGLLGAPNKPEALYWYKHAADHGSKEGETALAQLSHAMSLSTADVDKIIAGQHQDGGNDSAAPLSPVTAAPAAMPAPAKYAAARPAIKQTAMTSPTPITEPITEPPADKVTADAVFTDTDKADDTAIANTAMIAQIQEQLIKRGLFPGPADGNENAVTDDAIRAYQAANNLPADGRASQPLLTAMLGSEQPSPRPQQTAANIPPPAAADDGSLRPEDRQTP